MIRFAFWRYDFAKQDEIKMVMSSSLNRKINNDSVVLEFDMKVFFVFNCVRDLDSNFGWSLIPCVCDLKVMTNKFLFSHVLFSELDDLAS